MTADRDRKFGRLKSPDRRDARYPMRAVLPERVTPVTRLYRTGPVLDQGDTPQCVGYSAKQFLQSDPVETMDGPTATELYHAAQLEDEWPGENYEGSSVRGAAKALTKMDRLVSYVWGQDAADVRDWLILQGTVIMGTNWYQGMMDPDPQGYLRLTGRMVGGHAWLLCGYRAPQNDFQMINSWGKSWGSGGKAYLRFRDLDRLIALEGEACAALERPVVPVPDLATVWRYVQDLEQRVKQLESRR